MRRAIGMVVVVSIPSKWPALERSHTRQPVAHGRTRERATATACPSSQKSRLTVSSACVRAPSPGASVDRMGRVFFAMGMSLDGYVEDASGSFDFTAPDDEVHRIANEQARDAAVFVFGRRMYELMESYWPSAAAAPEELSEVAAEFARVYVETPRVVVSDSLGDVPDGVRLVRRADAAAEVARLAREHEGHIEVGGPTLAAAVFDLIDEFR